MPVTDTHFQTRSYPIVCWPCYGCIKIFLFFVLSEDFCPIKNLLLKVHESSNKNLPRSLFLVINGLTPFCSQIKAGF